MELFVNSFEILYNSTNFGKRKSISRCLYIILIFACKSAFKQSSYSFIKINIFSQIFLPTLSSGINESNFFNNNDAMSFHLNTTDFVIQISIRVAFSLILISVSPSDNNFSICSEMLTKFCLKASPKIV